MVVLIAGPILLGIIVYSVYVQLTSPADNLDTVEELPTQPFSAEEFTEDPFVPGTSEFPTGSDGSLPGTAQSGSGAETERRVTPPSSPTPGGTTPNSTSMPSGVTAAINSIEANGIKSSPYIASSLDTSNLPDGTTIRFDRSSWSSFSSESGSVKAIATIYGQNYPGSVTFSLSGGSWKASGYSLEGQ